MANRPKTRGRAKPPVTAWKPGQSGNPKGRPKGSGTAEIVEYARRLTLKVLKRLEAVVDETTDEKVLCRIAAIAAETARIPREEGPPPQTISIAWDTNWSAPSGADESGVEVELPSSPTATEGEP